MKKLAILCLALAVTACQTFPSKSPTNTATTPNPTIANQCYIQPDAKGQQYDTRLTWLVDSRNLPDINNADIIAQAKTALKNGCDINAPSPRTGFRPLELAILYGDVEFAKLLLDNGANPYLTINNHINPDSSIQHKNSFEFARLLINKDKNPNINSIIQLLHHYKK